MTQRKETTSIRLLKDRKAAKTRVKREMDKLLHGFNWEQLELTRWEKSSKITAREFLQL